ncbi:MAG: TIGR03936 family radical SAM-associated protein [Actinobacteria bacterium]|nr:TIGR03936 family radical SAM-associated protein [Actinomycetota bacterium]MCL6088015.1 TIGR03936 family radical SAM-associated protein [Actinomycetota bacterium]
MSEETKIRFKFNKIKEFRYLSHLEAVRLIIMAVNRTGIDIKYSSGFNPNPKISFSFPVPVGLASYAEYSDIEIHGILNAQDFKMKMNLQLKEGMNILEAKNTAGKISSLMADIKFVSYCFILKDINKNNAEKIKNELLNSSEFSNAIYSQNMVKDEDNSDIVKLNLIGYTKLLKNNKIFKFNNFLKYFKYLSNSNGVVVKDYFKEEAYVLREGILKTPLEIV